MLLNQAFSPFVFALQDTPAISPLILAIIAILLVVLFIWLLLRAPKVEKPTAVKAAARPDEQNAPVAAVTPEPTPTPSGEAMEASTVKTVEVYETPDDGEQAEVETLVMEENAGTVAAEAAAPAEDDLEIIEGIGPKMSAALKAAGIDTYAKLAESDVETLKQAIEAAGMNLAPSVGTWAEQAKFAADDDWEGLKNFQGQLVGGRRVN